jgi:CRP/FNR family cyclic AMP-dependent transcriptional regulator
MPDKHEKEIDSILRKIPFFEGLSETERAEVGGTILLRNFRRNDIILHEEETSRYLYLICSGKVKVLQVSTEGEEQILAIHRKGDFFGEMALLDGRTAPATVIALEETRIGLISREAFADHLRTNGKVVEGSSPCSAPAFGRRG